MNPSTSPLEGVVLADLHSAKILPIAVVQPAIHGHNPLVDTLVGVDEPREVDSLARLAANHECHLFSAPALEVRQGLQDRCVRGSCQDVSTNLLHSAPLIYTGIATETYPKVGIFARMSLIY